jgi:hypothetical protein
MANSPAVVGRHNLPEFVRAALARGRKPLGGFLLRLDVESSAWKMKADAADRRILVTDQVQNCVWHCLLRFFPVVFAAFGLCPHVDLSRLRIRRSGHAHKAPKPILEIEKLLQGHVQEAVEIAQHLLRPLAKRLALWR